MVDTGGRERVQSLTSQYYRRANIVLLVCSLDSEYTLNRLTKWFGEAKFYVDDPDVTYAVVGVKSDLLEHEREVTTDMLHGFAGHYNIDEASVFEVSARTGAGVKEMLKALCTAAVDTYNRSERQDALPGMCISLVGLLLLIESLPSFCSTAHYQLHVHVHVQVVLILVHLGAYIMYVPIHLPSKCPSPCKRPIVDDPMVHMYIRYTYKWLLCVSAHPCFFGP